MSESDTRAGFIAVVGRPNVGKSTLVNALVGEKISIVSPKPQTTRHRVLGVLTRGADQLVFIDTPGLASGAKRAIGRVMNRASTASIADADIVMVVVAAPQLTPDDRSVLSKLDDAKLPVVAVVNKVDRVKDKARLLPFIATLSELHPFDAVVPVSARTGAQLDVLTQALTRLLPPSPHLYPKDMRTDRDLRFRIGETIREKLMRRLEQELPYGIAVDVESLEDGRDGLRAGAVIWVERKGQKAIVIGKEGRMLKEAGRAARLELREALARPVHLDLWVKVRENWSDNERALRQLGHDL